MNYLIDTHVLIWFGETSDRLPARIRHIIEDTSNTIFVSHATIWEMTLKIALGKLKVKYSLEEWQKFLLSNKFTLLPNAFQHYQVLLTLPFHHYDPFDRLIISQAIAEGLIIITHDSKFLLYSVQSEHF